MSAPVVVFRGDPKAPDNLQPRLLARLRNLDPEQLQVVEIVVAAIERGAR